MKKYREYLWEFAISITLLILIAVGVISSYFTVVKSREPFDATATPTSIFNQLPKCKEDESNAPCIIYPTPIPTSIPTVRPPKTPIPTPTRTPTGEDR